MADDPVYDRPIVEEEPDGTVAYRASSFGYCIGALVRARMGMTPSAPPDFMLGKYAEGHEFERTVLEAGLGVDWVEERKESVLGRYGHPMSTGQITTNLRWSNKVVTCHPDAIVQHGSSKEYRVCEVKFLGPDMYNRIIADVEREGMLGLGSGYAWQASIEMLTTGLPMLYIIGLKEKVGDGVRLDGPPITFEFDKPCYSFIDIKMRVAEVEGWVARGEMPPCVVPFDYPCGYWAEHPEKEAKPVLDDFQLVHLVQSYKRNRGKADAVETEYQAIRAGIDARLAELGVEGGVCEGYTISMTNNRPGNVSWKKAYDALAKQTKSSVDTDLYRGAEVAGGIRMEKEKT